MIAEWHDALIEALQTDAEFTAALLALNLGSQNQPAVPLVTVSNQPLANFRPEGMPAWVLVPGDGDARAISNGGGEFLSIGGGQQTFVATLELALIWHQQDYDVAYRQRRELPEHMAALLLRHSASAGGPETWLQGWQSDRSARHPTQIAGFTIGADLTIQR